jgi:hypothetical protein
MAGDFNTQPFEPCYGLMMEPEGELGKTMAQGWEASRVVHDSVARIGKRANGGGEGKVGRAEWVDPGVGSVAGAQKPGGQAAGGEEGEEEGDDEDEGEGEGGEGSKGTGSTKEPMKNTRPAEPKDGILTLPELRELFLRGRASSKEEGGADVPGVPGVMSVYEEAARLLRVVPAEGEEEKKEKAMGQVEARLLGDRLGLTKGEWELMEGTGMDGESIGKGEPNWTSFTPLWRLTLGRVCFQLVSLLLARTDPLTSTRSILFVCSPCRALMQTTSSSSLLCHQPSVVLVSPRSSNLIGRKTSSRDCRGRASVRAIMSPSEGRLYFRLS